MDAFRAQLDELLGKDRNLLPTEKPNRPTTFSDPDVCKHFICGFCPHELFTNTKNDLGTCTKSHDESFKAEFEKQDRKTQIPYERDYLRYLEKITNDLDRKIKRDRERVMVQDKSVNEAVGEKVDAITEQILTLVKRAEDYAENGQTEHAQQTLEQIEALKNDKQALLDGDLRALGQEKRMTLCDICGAFLVVGDTVTRVNSHLEGKTHIGFDLIRKKIEELKQKHAANGVGERRDAPAPATSSSRGGGDRYDRDRDRDRRDRDRDRERDRERDRRDSHRDHYRDSRDRSDSYRDRPRDDRDRRRDDRYYSSSSSRSGGGRGYDRDRSDRDRERSASPPRSPQEAGQL